MITEDQLAAMLLIVVVTAGFAAFSYFADRRSRRR